MSNRTEKYDIFLSYRRDGGAETAKHLRDALTERGYKVFLDVESLRNGPFNTALYNVIENSKDFILILPPNGLDRCVNEKDWVRLEIEHARACEKNIVPVILKGFSFPENLPESIEFLRFQNAPPRVEITYFDAYVEKLQSFLTSKPRSVKKRLLAGLTAVLLLCAVVFGVYYSVSTYPLKTSDKNLVSALIDYLTLNLTEVDIAGNDYIKALDRAQAFAEGKTTDSANTVILELNHYREEIRKHRASITSLPDQLRQQLMNSRFDVGDLDSFKPGMQALLDPYINSLSYIADSLISAEGLRTEHKIKYLETMRSMAELDGENLFYLLNETLLPVTNEDALTTLKNKHLPLMPFIYGKGLYLTHDKEELEGKEETIYNAQAKLMDEYQESIQREEENVDPDQLLALLDALIDFRASYGLDTSELEETRERIKAKLEKLELEQQQLIEIQKEIEEARARLYEKFKPSSDDDQSMLWGKGMRFLTNDMPEAAAECFQLYVENGDEEDQFIGKIAVRFAENCTRLALKGGVVIAFYEENLPHQAVEIGDIIIEAEGEPIHSYAEFVDFRDREEKQIFDIRLLRFTDTSYELVDSVYDKSLGRMGLISLNDN